MAVTESFHVGSKFPNRAQQAPLFSSIPHVEAVNIGQKE
jgi:hypothetical protein